MSHDNDNTTKNPNFEDLVGKETDPSIDSAVREKLITARIGLLLKAPFYGNMATRLVLKNADKWLGTAATDGRNFYYNSFFIDKLTTREVEFLFGHEVSHNVYDHMGRCGGRHKKLFNIAADYAVNRDLIQYKIGTRITTVPCLYDSKYDDMTTEEIYDELYDNMDKMDLDSLLSQLVDEHMDADESGGDGRPAPLTEAEKRQIRDEIKEAMLSAAQAAQGAGNLPDGIARMVKSLTEPKMDWREMLQQRLVSAFNDDYSWMRPSRRSPAGVILPGMTPGEAVDIVVAIDTSGSISDKMVHDFLSEVQGIMNAFTSYKIKVFSFDTEGYNLQEYTTENIRNIADYEPQGHGGTDFDAIFNFLKEKDVVPERLVVFTDMMPFGSWGDELYCDTLWVNHGNPGAEAPFGITVEYEDHREDYST